MIANGVKTTVADAISSDRRLGELVSAACQTLDDMIDLPGVQVLADWSLAKDAQGRPTVVLELSDDLGSARADFSPDELENHREMRSRLNWLMGDLLQVRSRKLLTKLLDREQ